MTDVRTAGSSRALRPPTGRLVREEEPEPIDDGAAEDDGLDVEPVVEAPPQEERIRDLGKQALDAIPEEIEATFDDLINKRARVHTFYVIRQNEDGKSSTKMKVTYRAIDPKVYDKLRESHPPTAKQSKDGYAFNIDTFAPELIAAVSYKPKLSLEQATELYNSPNYATGEREGLFMHAQVVCNGAVDLPFTEPD